MSRQKTNQTKPSRRGQRVMRCVTMRREWIVGLGLGLGCGLWLLKKGRSERAGRADEGQGMMICLVRSPVV